MDLGIRAEPRRSLACTNIIENMNGTIIGVCANVKHWRNAAMAFSKLDFRGAGEPQVLVPL